MEWAEGTKVEFRRAGKRYEGAWFEGFVETPSRGGGPCKILFEKFEKNNGKPLVEKVRPDNVRPIPPQSQLPVTLPDGLFVEAYDKDCWSRGFIVKRVSCGQQFWLVSFPDSKTLRAYPLSALRPAQDWKDATWTLIPPV